MSRSKKYVALFLVFALAISMLAVTGCAKKTEDEGATGGGTERAAITSVDDLGEGDKVGVQSGTTGEQWAKDNLEPKGVEVIPYDTAVAAFQALKAGDVVGVINDITVSLDVTKDQSLGAEVIQEIKTDEGYGLGFNKANTALKDAFNWGLQEAVADGTYAELYEKWFGIAPEVLPEVSGYTKPAGDLTTIVAGKISVGSDTSFPPYESVDEGTGAIVGFDVDLVAAIAEMLGLESEFKTYAFDSLIPAMQAGTEFDMIASGMTATGDKGAERSQQIDFSELYAWNNQSLSVAVSE